MKATAWMIGGGLALFGLAAAASALFIPLGPGGDWGARLFPLMASGTLVVAGAAAALGNDAVPERNPAPVLPVLLLAVLAVAYVWLVGRMGFLIATALVVPPILWLFGIRRPLALGAAAVLLPLLLHIIFFRALGVFPPLGRWFDLLDLIPVL